jgi:hypothetical protein
MAHQLTVETTQVLKVRRQVFHLLAEPKELKQRHKLLRVVLQWLQSDIGVV